MSSSSRSSLSSPSLVSPFCTFFSVASATFSFTVFSFSEIDSFSSVLASSYPFSFSSLSSVSHVCTSFSCTPTSFWCTEAALVTSLVVVTVLGDKRSPTSTGSMVTTDLLSALGVLCFFEGDFFPPPFFPMMATNKYVQTWLSRSQGIIDPERSEPSANPSYFNQGVTSKR